MFGFPVKMPILEVQNLLSRNFSPIFQEDRESLMATNVRVIFLREHDFQEEHNCIGIDEKNVH